MQIMSRWFNEVLKDDRVRKLVVNSSKIQSSMGSKRAKASGYKINSAGAPFRHRFIAFHDLKLACLCARKSFLYLKSGLSKK